LQSKDDKYNFDCNAGAWSAASLKDGQHRCTNNVINHCINTKIIDNAFVPLAPGLEGLPILLSYGAREAVIYYCIDCKTVSELNFSEILCAARCLNLFLD
jgi:hypothetical protein